MLPKLSVVSDALTCAPSLSKVSSVATVTDSLLVACLEASTEPPIPPPEHPRPHGPPSMAPSLPPISWVADPSCGQERHIRATSHSIRRHRANY